MECKPDSVGLNPDDDLSTVQGNITNTNSTSEGNSTGNTPEVTSKSESAASVSVSAPSPGCLWNVPILYEEADVLSLRYSPVKGPNVNVTDTHPTLLSYPLPTQATGGTLNLQLTINAVSMSASVRKSQVRKLSVLLKQYLIDMCVCLCVLFADKCDSRDQSQCGGLFLSRGSSSSPQPVLFHRYHREHVW